VVDDDADIRELLTELLKDEGYSVESAANGQEALTWLVAGSSNPCVILLDLMMPIMNGWELGQRLRQLPRFADVPVIVISADRDVPAHAQELKVAAFLQKPLELRELLQTVQQYC